MDKLRSLIVENFRGRGRLSRKGLWGSIGLFYIFALLSMPLEIVLGMRAGGDMSGVSPAGMAVLVLVSVLIAWFMLGALVRRLHDRGKCALWLLAFFGPTVVFQAVVANLPPLSTALGTVVFMVGLFGAGPFMIWGTIEIFTVRGQPGDNRFGPDPLAPAEVASEAGEVRA